VEPLLLSGFQIGLIIIFHFEPVEVVAS